MATPWGAGRYTTAPGTAAASATTARRASRTGQTASKPIWAAPALRKEAATARSRSEEHTSELQSLVISYAVFCLKKKKRSHFRQHQLYAWDPRARLGKPRLAHPDLEHCAHGGGQKPAPHRG